MSSTAIETLIKNDLETFLYYKSLQNEVSVNDAIEIAAYVGANFLRVIFAKNKDLKPEELNGVFGIISNVYHDLFGSQFGKEDYERISRLALELLKDTGFDSKSRSFFTTIIHKAPK